MLLLPRCSQGQQRLRHPSCTAPTSSLLLARQNALRDGKQRVPALPRMRSDRRRHGFHLREAHTAFRACANVVLGCMHSAVHAQSQGG